MCTIVTMSKNGVVLTGNNEDYTEPRTKIWFISASKDGYGRVYVGFDSPSLPSSFQGGMNEHGLFMDMNAVNPTGWQRDPGKPTFNGDLVEKILTDFATVQEVVEFFQQHNVSDLNILKVPVADAKGNSVIVEWGQGAQHFIFKEGDYQISTNFIQSEYKNPDEYPCQRYKIADQILKNAETATIDVIRSVLSATHFDVPSTTLYSNICDLKQKQLYLYFFHNFEETVVFDLEKELKKGNASYPIPSLFLTTPFVAHQYNQIGSKIVQLLQKS
ncbi:MAG: linear amide C-N hydrolase [Candidatus Bathyarchaeota archaeon]|nr:MAG: linear amide C-N hydrolase [Candidatus Bathyarchaeota archaeon]